MHYISEGENEKMLHTNVSVNEKGHLTFCGADTVSLAEKYGTALMLIDENRIREKASAYVKAMKRCFGGDSAPLYASKALCFAGIYKIVAEEGMSVDIVSSGELYTAAKAGFPLEKVYFHGNNKTDEDIEYAIDMGVGCFIADGYEEIDKIDSYAAKKGIKQRVLLRLTPGIDPHTHEKISTGKIDCKFGTPIETGQAEKYIAYVLTKKNIELKGYHCHIGSQVFDCSPFCDAADIMIKYIAHIERSLGYRAEVLNLGGGFGVRYVESDPHIDIEENIRLISEHIKQRCEEFGVKMPTILMEPGRSIVADAGMTLYSVGTVKSISDYKSYVSVNGGMTDNPRYTLYGSQYTMIVANKANEPADFKCTVGGCCCESGDLLAEDIFIQKVQRGDLLAVLVTGAYNYSMASNYNRVPRPPIVVIKDGVDRLAVRRETREDMLSLEVLD